MAQLQLRKTYQNGQTPSSDDIDGLRTPLEIFLNLTGIGSDNIQDNAVTSALLDSSSVTTNSINANAVTRAKMASVNYQLSSSSGTYSTSSLGINNVTNLSVTITTNGRPVMLALVSGSVTKASFVGVDSESAAASPQYVIFTRDSSSIAFQAISAQFAGGGDVLFIPSSAYRHIDVVAAGTYTYRAAVVVTYAGPTITVEEAKLLAYEIV